MNHYGFRKRQRKISDSNAAPVPKRLKKEPLSETSAIMPPPLPLPEPRHDSLHPEPEGNFVNPNSRPYPVVIRLPTRRYPGKGAKGCGIPLLLQQYEEKNRASPPRRISKKEAGKVSRRLQFMTKERKKQETRYRNKVSRILASPLVGGRAKEALMRQPNITDSPLDEFEFLESMATSDEEEEEEEEDIGPFIVKAFKKLHVTLQKAIIDGIEDDMHGQQRWRYPPMVEGEERYYAAKTILNVDFMYIDDIDNEINIAMMWDGISPPDEEEVQAAERFLILKGLSKRLLSAWLGDEVYVGKDMYC
ncbi:hypothetical protein FKW77_009271 [Venturia effusa]|uniref:Uncharacterized protein n=1 Tax=Venturia effusa TaxID=50376 RepID=A0A517L646_9PEZI|nr:hypothetical protein FKW77_009271 [Venturia effusa]